jgi:predicted double-glycine peptidase
LPPLYIAVHLALAAVCAAIAFRVPRRSWLGRVAAGVGLVVVIAGFIVERRSELAWGAMLLGWGDAVFFTNLTLPGVAVLLTVMWRGAADRPARIRALALSPFALGVSLWSLHWYFLPVPPGLQGAVNNQGYCPQTSEQSCGAAAAVTLLDRHGIATTEAEMAELCLTRDGLGTTPLGTFRGLAIRGGEKGLYPRLALADPRGDLSGLPAPCIISVGLRGGAPAEVSERMEGYGWTPGLRHAVVVLSVDPAAKMLLVADPSYGLEPWNWDGLEWIWDGKALTLE